MSTTTYSESVNITETVATSTGIPAQAQTRGKNITASIGGAILLFIIFFMLSWIVLFTFNPGMVQTPNSTANPIPPDAARCFVASLIISLIICIIIWLFMRSC